MPNPKEINVKSNECSPIKNWKGETPKNKRSTFVGFFFMLFFRFSKIQ